MSGIRTPEWPLTDREYHARQVASRRVTRRPDDRCTLDAAGAPLDHFEKCAWCRTSSPRPARLMLWVAEGQGVVTDVV